MAAAESDQDIYSGDANDDPYINDIIDETSESSTIKQRRMNKSKRINELQQRITEIENEGGEDSHSGFEDNSEYYNEEYSEEQFDENENKPINLPEDSFLSEDNDDL